MAEMERHSEDVNKRIVWMKHVQQLMDAMKLVVVCHLARLLPLLLKWAHAYDIETVVMVSELKQKPKLKPKLNALSVKVEVQNGTRVGGLLMGSMRWNYFCPPAGMTHASRIVSRNLEAMSMILVAVVCYSNGGT